MSFFSIPSKGGNVEQALQYASRRTGAGFDFLKSTAQRESNLDPAAKAGTSSASGLFQFIERTWLAMVKEAGPRHGYGKLAAKIEASDAGTYRVADGRARSEILKLRDDPRAAALMAGELAVRNADDLRTALGRTASDGELYAAHFLGSRGAAELVRLAETAPNAPAAERFPAAAAANRSIFYTEGGAPRTAADVYSRLVSGYDATPAIPEQARYIAFAASHANPDRAFHGLFTGQGAGLGPIGRAVSTFWSRADEAPAAVASGFTEQPAAATIVAQPARTAYAASTPGGNAVPEDMASAPQAEIEARPAGRRAIGAWADDPSLPVR